MLDRLYAVAEDPALYDRVLEPWHQLVAPLQAQAPDWTCITVPGPDFAAHFARLTRLLGSDRVQRRPREDQQALSRITISIAFTLDAALRVTAVNAAAAAATPVTVGSALRDLPILPEDRRALATLIRGLFTDPDPGAATLRIRHPRSFTPILLNLRPVFPDPERLPTGAPLRPDYVLVVSSLLRWPDSHAEMLQNAFGMTPAEYAVMRALAAGHSVNEIAEMRGRSVQTVRAQVKALLQKTETRSQPELVRLMLSTVETAPPQDASQPAPRISRGIHQLEDRPFRTLPLPGGRQIEYLEFGDPAGRPVLYSPGLVTLCRWPARAERAAAERGLRVIVPLRPRIGGSSPLPPGTPRGPGVAHDLLALLDRLDLPQVTLMAQNHDLFFACMLQDAAPRRLEQVIGLGSVMPLCCAIQYARMSRWPRFMQSGARYTPDLLRDMARGTFAMSHCIGKLQALRLIYASSPDDLRVLREPETQEAVLVGTEATLSHESAATEAYIDDLTTIHRTDWGPSLRRLIAAVPVTFVHGDHDPSMHPDTVRDRAAAFPGATYLQLRDAGQMLFFTRWREILPLLDKKRA
ncbi:bifunctional helix-turn-helix transcriptional regulator/alpha/beta hydrolase [Pseudooceanicola sp. 502str34]